MNETYKDLEDEASKEKRERDWATIFKQIDFHNIDSLLDELITNYEAPKKKKKS